MRIAVLLSAVLVLQACQCGGPGPNDAGGGGEGGGTATGGGTSTGGGGNSTGGGGNTGGGGGSEITLETQAPASVRAGEELLVQCVLTGATAPTTVLVTPTTGLLLDGGSIVATRAGFVEVVCSAPSLGVDDPTPAQVEVIAGPPAATSTSTSPGSLVAGELLQVTCGVADLFGNSLDDAGSPSVAASPGPVVATDGGFTLTTSGAHVVRCELPGADAGEATVTVTAALPSSLLLERVPELMTYDAGVVGVRPRVLDRFGNEVSSATVVQTVTGDGGLLQPDGGIFLPGDGVYRVAGQVNPPTHEDAGVVAFVDFLVNGAGPGINCEYPADLEQLDLASGSSLTFLAHVDDGNGVGSVTVNGANAAIGPGGLVSASLTTRFGMNSVVLVATDAEGKQSTRLCSFMAGNTWLAEGSAVSDALAIQLQQTAVHNPSAPLDSLSDLTTTVVRAGSLPTLVNADLTNINPLKPTSCDVSACPFGACVCVYESRIDHTSIVRSGSPVTTLSLVNGGIALQLTGLTFSESLRLRGTNEDLTATATLNNITAQLTFDVALSNGRPRVTVRAGTEVVTVATPAIDAPGASAEGLAALTNTANAVVRPRVQASVRDWLRTVLAGFLDSTLGAPDVRTVGSTSNVPRLSAGSVPLSLGIANSSVSVTASRLLVGMSTVTTTAMPAHARPNLGTLLVAGSRPLSPSSTEAGTCMQHQGSRAERLTALWRGGWFDGALSAGRLAAFPSFSATLTVLLPPVTTNLPSGGRFSLELGGASVTVSDPELPSGLVVRFDSMASANMTFVAAASDLRPTAITVDTLVYQVLAGGPLTTLEQNALIERLEALMALLTTRLLNDAEQAVPLISFSLPASAPQFGLPANQSFGVVTPAYGQQGPWSLLSGPTGLR